MNSQIAVSVLRERHCHKSTEMVMAAHNGVLCRYSMCLMMSSPNSEHLRRVAPSIWRSKS